MFATDLEKSLERRFPKFGADVEAFAMANFLDPRYMGLHLMEDETVYIETKHKTEEMVCNLLVNEAALNTSTDSTSSDSHKPSPSATELLLKRSKKSAQDSASPGESEVNVFLGMPKIPPNSRGDKILEWWKVNSGSLPGLSKLAKKYLAVPASSATSERLFSVSGNVVSKIRTSLDTENVSSLVYLHNNLRVLNGKK